MMMDDLYEDKMGGVEWLTGTCSTSQRNIFSLHQFNQKRGMAMKKAAGSTQNNRKSNPKYLGVKLFGGQQAKPGSIIIRQRGTKIHPGFNVGMVSILKRNQKQHKTHTPKLQPLPMKHFQTFEQLEVFPMNNTMSIYTSNKLTFLILAFRKYRT